MSSRMIVVLFQASAVFVGISALSSLWLTSAGAESAQPSKTAGAAPLASAGLQTTAGNPNGVSSVIKTPAAASTMPGARPVSAVQTQADNVELLTPAQRRSYQRASSAFASFCHDWERLLHEREVNNLEHLSWQQSGGLEMATYTGYGKVESCECHASKEGLPIGKIRYEEMLYSIAGKTVNQARHAAPKIMHEIGTLEIFSWEKGKWFY